MPAFRIMLSTHSEHGRRAWKQGSGRMALPTRIARSALLAAHGLGPFTRSPPGADFRPGQRVCGECRAQHYIVENVGTAGSFSKHAYEVAWKNHIYLRGVVTWLLVAVAVEAALIILLVW